MSLSVVISTNDTVSLGPLLCSIQAQTVKAEVIVEQHSRFPNRAAGFSKSNSDLVLFLDADCELPRDTYFEEMIFLFKTKEDLDVVGGLYLSRENASIVSCSYNKMCNLWVKLGESRHLLGGVFCIRRCLFKDWPVIAHFWGGEDAFLFRELHERGFRMQAESHFSVFHHDKGSLRKLFRRAWAHGQSRETYKLHTPKRYKKIWTQKRILFSDFSLSELFLALVHFSLVEISGLLTRPKISPIK